MLHFFFCLCRVRTCSTSWHCGPTVGFLPRRSHLRWVYGTVQSWPAVRYENGEVSTNERTVAFRTVPTISPILSFRVYTTPLIECLTSFCVRFFLSTKSARHIFLLNRNVTAVCSRSLDPFYTVSYYIKWAKTSWIYSTSHKAPFLKAKSRFLQEIRSLCARTNI